MNRFKIKFINLISLVSIVFLFSSCCCVGKKKELGSIANYNEIQQSSYKSPTVQDLTYDFENNIGDRVFFSFNSSSLSGDAKSKLDQQIAFLKQNSELNAIIEGHTDERGTSAYNLGLGERRANVVLQYLVTKGISASRFEVISYGKEKPAVIGMDEKSYAKNRRVVVVPYTN